MPEPSVMKCPCVCGALTRINDADSGAISTSCPDCKAQGFYKSPRAVAAFRAKYGAAAPAPAAPVADPAPKPRGGFLDDFK